MAIAHVDGGASDFANSSAISPAVDEGDFLLVAGIGHATDPWIGLGSNFTSIANEHTVGGGTNDAIRAGYRFAPSGGISSTGTWSDADHVIWVVMSGVRASNPIGNIGVFSIDSTSSTQITYPAVEWSGVSGSWYVAIVSRVNGSGIVDNAPSHLTFRERVPAATPTGAIHSGARDDDYPQNDVTGAGVGSKVIVVVIEILPEGTAPPGAPELFTSSVTDVDVALGTTDFEPHEDEPSAPHASTDWQVTTAADTGFASPVVNVHSTTDLLAYIAEGVLTEETDYIARARHNSNTTSGAWSDTIAFTTESTLPTPTTPTLSDPPTNIEEDEVTLTVSDFAHSEGTTTAEDYDPLTNDLPYPVARQWQITLTADTGFADPEIDTDLNSDISLERTFGGLAANTAYRARTRVQDGKHSTLSSWSNVVVFTTDATPADRPAQPTITATCTGRGATLAGDTFTPFGAETHAQSQWRARPSLDSSVGQDSTTTSVHLTSFSGWAALPAGTWNFDVRYKGSNNKWSLWSDADTCVVYDRPRPPVIESPVSGKVISAAQLVTISMDAVPDVAWNFIWEAREENDSWTVVQDSTSLTYNFPIVGKANGFYQVRVKACYPTGHDAEGVCGDYAMLTLRLDRTGVRAVSYSFVGLEDPADIPGGPLLIWDNDDDDVTAELVDEEMGGSGPSVGILMRNSQVLATRQSVLAFTDLGLPIAGRFTTEFSIAPRERGVWWGHKMSHSHYMKGGIAYRAIGTGATNRSGLQLVARTGIQPFPFYPQTTGDGVLAVPCICDCGPGVDDSCFCCSGLACHPCTTCHGSPSACTCVSGAATLANRARTQSGTLWEYGISYGRGSIERFGREQGTSLPRYYATSTLTEDGDQVRGLGVTIATVDEDDNCLFSHMWYKMEVDVAREGSQWRVRSRVLGPGMDPDTWTQNSLLDLGEYNGDMPCGYCGLAMWHLASNLTNDYGVLFRSFSASDLEYEGCEPPEELIVGCEADWDFTLFENDDITPWYGTYSGTYLEGSVGEADFYSLRTCPRPYLKVPKDFSETEIDYAAGASTIGAITVEVVDKRLTQDDQDTGIVTARIAEAVGRRAILRRWRDDLGMVVVFDGVVESWEVVEDRIVTYRFHLRDPRERERDVELFSRNETFALWPESGPIASYGQLPGDLGYLLTPAQPEDAMTFNLLSGVGGDDGIHHGYVVLANVDAGYIENAVAPHSESTWDASTNTYRYRDITVRWRPSAGGDWVYLRDMPSHTGAPAVGHPEDPSIFTPAFSWILRMSSFDDDEIPSNGQLIDLQILAAKTTETTPFFWDLGTFGDLLLDIWDGLFSDVVPRIHFNRDRLEEWATETPNARFILREPVKNMREWVEQNIFAALGWAPSFDEDMRIIPSEWRLPAAGEELIELDSDWIIPVGGFSHSTASVVNHVRYTYIRESLPLEEELNSFADFVNNLGRYVYRQIYGDHPWTRLVEQEVVREYYHGDPDNDPDNSSVHVIGRKTIEYKPVTVREFAGSIQTTGIPGSLINTPHASEIADKIGLSVITRFGWGAAEYVAEVRSGTAHGPGFDPFTLDLEVGQWVKANVPWLPDFAIGERNLYRYMQIKSITDLDIHKRRLRLIDGGPVLTLDGESEGVEDLLDAPTIGTLEESDFTSLSEVDLRVEVPITFPVDAPVGYTVRVDYAVSDTEPATVSGLWRLVGYLTAEGSIYTPPLPAGATVWIRARGEMEGRRPSAWTPAESLTLGETPGLVFLEPSLAGSLPSIDWTPNEFCGGVRVEYSVGTIGHTASFSAFDDFDATDESADLTGVEVAEGEEIYIRVTAYEGFSLGAVTGAAGGVYVVRIDRPFPYSGATHGLNDHSDTDLGAAADRPHGSVPAWNEYTGKYESEEVPTLPIDLTTDVTGVLPADNGGTGLDEADLSGHAGEAVVVNGTEDGFEFASLGSGGGYAEGTSFPGSPSSGDKFYRTDRNILYFYDGTRWLSVQQFSVEGSLAASITATENYRFAVPFAGTYSLWLDSWSVVRRRAGTGQWDWLLRYFSADGTATLIDTASGSGDSDITYTDEHRSLGSVLNANARTIVFTASEISGTATFIGSAALHYRLIG